MKPDQRRLFTEAETSRALADIYALFLRKIGDTTTEEVDEDDRRIDEETRQREEGDER